MNHKNVNVHKKKKLRAAVSNITYSTHTMWREHSFQTTCVIKAQLGGRN